MPSVAGEAHHCGLSDTPAGVHRNKLELRVHAVGSPLKRGAAAAIQDKKDVTIDNRKDRDKKQRAYNNIPDYIQGIDAEKHHKFWNIADGKLTTKPNNQIYIEYHHKHKQTKQSIYVIIDHLIDFLRLQDDVVKDMFQQT